MFEDKIAKGIALLDQMAPGWEEFIHLGSLNVNNTENCVLGQIFMSFSDGEAALFGTYCFGQCIEHGFNYSYYAYPQGMDVGAILTEEWKTALTNRFFETYMGNIGEPVRHIELEPLEEPSPVEEPSSPVTPAAPSVPLSDPIPA